VINTDHHNKKEKDLIPIKTTQEEIMWVHPDIIKNQQWTTVTKRKSKRKARSSYSNVVSVSVRETKESIASITSSGEEEYAFAADISAPSTSKTRSGK